jgi:hypothetical protein
MTTNRYSYGWDRHGVCRCSDLSGIDMYTQVKVEWHDVDHVTVYTYPSGRVAYHAAHDGLIVNGCSNLWGE